MNVADLMKKPAVACRPNDSLREAARLLWDYDLGAIGVTRQDGVLLGILTDRDICMACYFQDASMDAIPVSSAMSKTIFSVRPHESLATAEKVMADHQVRRLPVVDDQRRLLGFLTANDLVRMAEATPRKDHARDEALHTLAVIGQPRVQLQTSTSALMTKPA